MTWTKDTLKQWFLDADESNIKHRAAMSKALLFLYARQTASEQSSGTTNQDNGVGFSGADAEFMSSVARGVQKYGNMTPGQAKYMKKKLAKYAGQLMDLANPATPAPADTVAA